jgi:hypothetical protein
MQLLQMLKTQYTTRQTFRIYMYVDTHVCMSSGFCDHGGVLGYAREPCSLVTGSDFDDKMVAICSVKMLAIAH